MCFGSRLGVPGVNPLLFSSTGRSTVLRPTEYYQSCSDTEKKSNILLLLKT